MQFILNLFRKPVEDIETIRANIRQSIASHAKENIWQGWFHEGRRLG